MAEKGFAIRCPHCRKWNVWPDVHPEEVALESKEELKQILRKLELAGLSGKTESFFHDKLLRCKSPRWLCPASFEAFVCRSERDTFDCLEVVEAWSFKRDYRLFKKDCERRWENQEEGKYYGILFNTQPISRRTEIELEQLVDRELLSRWILGVGQEIKAPFTVFAANVFKPKDGERTAYWLPIELYSGEKALVPETFNEFCRCCRKIIVERLIEKFESQKFSVLNCPIYYGENGKCAGKDPACMEDMKDWRHCPAFRKERWKCLCTSSDLELIWEIEDKWKMGKSLERGIRHRCPAGFLEIGFPIVAHNHVVGIGMTGQLYFDEGEIKEVDDLVREWSILEGCEKELKRAKQKLINEERLLAERGESKFWVSERRVNKIINKLNNNIGRISEIANSRYRDFRVRSESAFREEILGFIQNHKMERDFFDKRVTHVLERMRDFWAFEAVYLAGYFFETKDISVIGFSHKYKRPKAFGIPGKKEGKADLKGYQMHPCPYLHLRGKAVPRSNRLLKDLLSIFENAIQDRELEVPDGKYYFFVLIPLLKEVYVFVFAVRVEAAVSSLKQLVEGGVSDLCQDEILETCTEVIYEFGDLRSFGELRDRASEAERVIEIAAVAGQFAHRLGNAAGAMPSILDDIEERLAKMNIIDSEVGNFIQELRLGAQELSRMKGQLSLDTYTRELDALDVSACIEEAIRSARVQSISREIMIRTEVPREMPRVSGVKVVLIDTIVNLLKNAVEANAKNINISSVSHLDTVDIVVSDDGVGISKLEQKKIFLPLFSSKKGGRDSSVHGIGLWVSRVLIARWMGGNISVDSEEGIGSRFTVTLKAFMQ